MPNATSRDQTIARASEIYQGLFVTIYMLLRIRPSDVLKKIYGCCKDSIPANRKIVGFQTDFKILSLVHGTLKTVSRRDQSSIDHLARHQNYTGRYGSENFDYTM